jgi:hypothetical protein
MRLAAGAVPHDERLLDLQRPSAAVGELEHLRPHAERVAPDEDAELGRGRQAAGAVGADRRHQLLDARSRAAEGRVVGALHERRGGHVHRPSELREPRGEGAALALGEQELHGDDGDQHDHHHRREPCLERHRTKPQFAGRTSSRCTIG